MHCSLMIFFKIIDGILRAALGREMTVVDLNAVFALFGDDWVKYSYIWDNPLLAGNNGTVFAPLGHDVETDIRSIGTVMTADDIVTIWKLFDEVFEDKIHTLNAILDDTLTTVERGALMIFFKIKEAVFCGDSGAESCMMKVATYAELGTPEVVLMLTDDICVGGEFSTQFELGRHELVDFIYARTKMVFQKSYTAYMDHDDALQLGPAKSSACLIVDDAFGPKDIWKTKFQHMTGSATTLGICNCLGSRNSDKGSFVTCLFYTNAFWKFVMIHGVHWGLDVTP